MEVSIIGSFSSNTNLEQFRNLMRTQTFQDFELICEVGESNYEAWVRGISRARGQILLFVDAEAKPIDENWLKELIAESDSEKMIVKGPEIFHTPLDPSSLAGYRSVFASHPFDESFCWAEDTELFCRLKEAGHEFVQLNCAPVIHLSKPGSRLLVRRSFRYGLYWARLLHRYAEPVEVATAWGTFKLVIALSLNLLGWFVGSLLYWNERHFNRNPSTPGS